MILGAIRMYNVAIPECVAEPLLKKNVTYMKCGMYVAVALRVVLNAGSR